MSGSESGAALVQRTSALDLCQRPSALAVLAALAGEGLADHLQSGAVCRHLGLESGAIAVVYRFLISKILNSFFPPFPTSV